MKFDGIDALKVQMEADAARARAERLNEGEVFGQLEAVYLRAVDRDRIRVGVPVHAHAA